MTNQKLTLFFGAALLANFSHAASFQGGEPPFYSAKGEESVVTFKAEVRTRTLNVNQIQAWSEAQKQAFIDDSINSVLAFLPGPLTNRELGAPQRTISVKLLTNEATSDRYGTHVPFEYTGVWILKRELVESGGVQVDVPFDAQDLYTPHWQNCTDPHHRESGMFGYFWDPGRAGCDQAVNLQYQRVRAAVGAVTPATTDSYPEYKNLLREVDGRKELKMTLAFGYVADPGNPNPDRDNDEGARAFRDFKKSLRKYGSFQERTILAKEYVNHGWSRNPVGTEYTALINGVDVSVRVVINAGIDQMELFAKSFAQDHEGFFGWFGHSRVGSGFDAIRFEQAVRSDPKHFSISKDYQLIYWGGCNSYTYYTVPFFQLKAKANSAADPQGTKALDIVANGLPSYFAVNNENAEIMLKSLLDFNRPTSYQKIVKDMEANAGSIGRTSLVLVLGDEDNQQP